VCKFLEAWRTTGGAWGLIGDGIPGLEVRESGIPLSAVGVGSGETLTEVTGSVFSSVGELPFSGGRVSLRVGEKITRVSPCR
jgi:hypothetical protein